MVSRKSGGTPNTASDRMRPLWLLALVALFVAAPLLPSESVAGGGPTPVFAMFWSVLLIGWSLWAVLSRTVTVRWGLTTTAVLVFLSWHTLSAIWMATDGQPRATLNTMWQWVAFGTLFFLGRQLIQTARERRAVVAVCLALATCLAVHGYYQYFISMPQTRRAYEADPDLALSKADIVAPAGSPERELFENRLNSTEPLASFSLTNSFAGFLTPWLLLALVSAWQKTTSAEGWGQAVRILRLVLLAAIAGCLILTKSRSAWLATLFGIGLLLVYGRRSGWRPDGRWVAAAGLMLVLLAAAATAAGGLDWLVVAESSKALRYRLEYWQATVELVKDYPLFGAGPGNFQQYYTAYKLPQASETVADPHNFVFEIWATCGTPGLLAFLGVLGCFAWQLGHTRAESKATLDRPDEEPIGGVRAIYWGGLAGLLLAFPIGATVGYQPEMVLLAIGAPVAALTIAAWNSWVAAGRLSRSAVVVALTALLVNLLAAGGIGFAGVANSFWLLLVLGLSYEEAPRTPRTAHRLAWACLAVSIVIGMAIYWTAYRPALYGEEKLAEGRLLMRQGLTTAADQALREATRRDPYAVKPWQELANLHFERWLSTQSERDYQQFEQAMEAIIAHHPRSSRARLEIGNWLLVAYRFTRDSRRLREAIGHYRMAVALYPTHSFYHAQLAWALHLAEDPAAATEAETALRLDEVNPHSEQGLDRRVLLDPGPLQAGDGPAGPGNQDSEQWMQVLRNKAVGGQ